MAEPSYVPPMTALLTADELLHLHLPDKRVELVRGVLGETLDGEDVVPGFSCSLDAML